MSTTTRKEKSEMPNAYLHELFIDELRDVLGAEKQLLKGLKKMALNAHNAQLKKAFEKHYNESENQIERLKRVFSMIDRSPRSKKCKAMEGLLKEADELMEEFDGSPSLDHALIAAAQKVEHYEIASYGCLKTYANLMGHTDAEELLTRTLDEEKQTDQHLTDLALTLSEPEA